MSKMHKRIEGFLSALGLTQVEQTSPNRWVVTVLCNAPDDQVLGDEVSEDEILEGATYAITDFSVEIYLMGDWVSFTSVAMKDLYGARRSDFYELVFKLNYYLNGTKFALTDENNDLIILAERHIDGLNFEQFKSVFEQFLLFYVKWFPELVDFAVELKLKFRKKSKQNPLVNDRLARIVGNNFHLDALEKGQNTEIEEQSETNR